MLTQRAYLVALIRHRKALGILPRRRRTPRQLQPDGVRLGYYQQIRGVLAPAKAIVDATIVPHLARWVEQAARIHGDGARADSTYEAKDAIDKAIEAFNRRSEVQRGNLDRIAEQAGRRTSDFQREQLSRQVRAALGVELPPQDVNLHARIAEFTARNVSLIGSIPRDYFGQIEAKVIHGVSSGRRAEDIASDLEDRFGVAESRAKLIARDQVGKFYGALNEARQAAIGIAEYTWDTVHDNRVRESHAELDGENFEWSSPPVDSETGEPITPGSAVNCRCGARPVFSGILGEVVGE